MQWTAWFQDDDPLDRAVGLLLSYPAVPLE